MAQSAGEGIDGIIVEEEMVFTLVELCRAAGAAPAQIAGLVDEGVLDPIGNGPDEWAFGGPALRTTRVALRLTTELELGPAEVALVLGLLEEIHALRARLRRAGIG